MGDADKSKVLDAIGALGYRATAADVSVKTGLALNSATHCLNAIAAETGGTLEVSPEGQIAYKFNPLFRSAYALHGLAYALNAFSMLALNMLYLAFRLSFGVMLVLSLIVVVALIVIIIVAAIAALFHSDSGGDAPDINPFGVFEFFDLTYLPDFFRWGTPNFYASHTPSYTPATVQPEREQTAAPGNFFHECFSFLFGDGNPNVGFEEAKWNAIGSLIRSCKGVVTAEQLAPFTGADPDDEDAVLPVLVRFDGRPAVTPSGHIAYVFPAMQVTVGGAASRERASLPGYLEEASWRFSVYPLSSLIKVTALATVNFLGSWWLFRHISDYALLYHVRYLIDFLLAYGGLFLAIPLIRASGLAVLNAGIASRNKRRQASYERLYPPSSELKAKLLEARELAPGQIKVDPSRLAYTSDMDLLEQRFASGETNPPDSATDLSAGRAELEEENS